MNLLLPYAEDTFERMVSCCAECGSNLGWRDARGIGNCDVCGCEVAPSLQPELPSELREGYRIFAQLASLHSDTMDAACAKLPDPLSSVAPGTLIRLALQIGGIVQDQPVIAASRRVVACLPKPLLAGIVSAGTELLRSWPHGLRSWVAATSEELHDRPADLNATRNRLRRLVDRQREAPDLVSIVSNALPDLKMQTSHVFSGGRRYYLYNEVAGLLGLAAPKMARLKGWPDLKFYCRSDSERQYGQFDANQIDELIDHFRGTFAFNSCASQLKLPLYAVEQLCQAGILAFEDHPAVVATRSWNSVRQKSMQELMERLLAICPERQWPGDCVSLSVAVKRIGGRLKPWSTIMQALISGDLPFWMVNGNAVPTGILVRPAELAAFDQKVIAPPDIRFLQSDIMSQMDAAEVLNLKPALLSPKRSGIPLLHFSLASGALVVPRADVLAIARSTAWNAEIALHLGIHHQQVELTMRSCNITRVATGWCRSQLINQRILPQIP